MNLNHQSICTTLAAALALSIPFASASSEDTAFAIANDPSAMADDQETLLLDMVVVWLTRNFDLPASFDHPQLVLASPETLAHLRYGPGARVDQDSLVAVYLDEEHRIYLNDAWDGRTPAGLSVIVHEMVHHLQDAAGLRFACPGEREAVAYQAQDRWLEIFGGSLAEDFEIDKMTLMLRTTCGY